MKALLDNTIAFEEITFELEVQSPARNIVQRAVAGLDGQVAIEMGLRGRKIIQKGELKAPGASSLQSQIEQISKLIDGNLHCLRCPDGRVFENLIVDSFQTSAFLSSGTHKACKYTITYIQQVY